MRTILVSLAVLACAVSGCMLKTEPMTSEEMQKYTRPKAELATNDAVEVRQPKPETCLEAGKMYETLARSATDTMQKRELAWRGKQAYSQALRLKPGWASAEVGLARLEDFEGNPQSATAHYQQVLQMVNGKDKEDGQACHEAGLFFARYKQFDLSITAMQKASQFDPSNRTFAMNYGFTLARAGRFDDAFQHFGKIMNSSDASFQMAQMAQHVGDVERSRMYAGLALQNNPNNTQAQQLLASLNQPAVPAAVQQVQNTEAAPAKTGTE